MVVDEFGAAPHPDTLTKAWKSALETARQFTTFYHDCPVLTAETEALRVARAQLCMATLQTLRNALNLLGIEALERM